MFSTQINSETNNYNNLQSEILNNATIIEAGMDKKFTNNLACKECIQKYDAAAHLFGSPY